MDKDIEEARLHEKGIQSIQMEKTSADYRRVVFHKENIYLREFLRGLDTLWLRLPCRFLERTPRISILLAPALSEAERFFGTFFFSTPKAFSQTPTVVEFGCFKPCLKTSRAFFLIRPRIFRSPYAAALLFLRGP